MKNKQTKSDYLRKFTSACILFVLASVWTMISCDSFQLNGDDAQQGCPDVVSQSQENDSCDSWYEVFEGVCFTIDTLSELIVYDFSGLLPYLSTGKENPIIYGNIAYACQAAFTSNLDTHFYPSRIVGDYISDEGYFCGSNSDDLNGAFVFWRDKTNGVARYRFLSENWCAVFDSASTWNHSCGFRQLLIIQNGKIVCPLDHKSLKGVDFRRCLCEKDSKLMIIDSRKKVDYPTFVILLAQYGVKNAINLQMGSGWNYSSYKNRYGDVVHIHPHIHDFSTNWLYFIAYN